MKINRTQHRVFTVDEVSDGGNYVTMSLSSEKPVDQVFGKEILLHGEENIDLSRANTSAGLPLLINHNSMQLPIGRLKNIRIDADKKLRGDAYFSGRAEAQAIMMDVLNGILTDTSIGYRILDYKVQKGKDGEPDCYIVTRWLIFEGSIVGIPADASVGVGRSMVEDDEMVEPSADEPLEEPATEEPSATTGPSETEWEVIEVIPFDGPLPDVESEETIPDDEIKEELVNSETEEKRSQKISNDAELLLEQEKLALATVARNLNTNTEKEIQRVLATTTNIEEARKLLLTPINPQSISKRMLITEGNKDMISNEMISRGLANALKGNFDLDESVAGVFSRTGERSFKADIFNSDYSRANEMTTASKGTNTIYEQNIGYLDLLKISAVVMAAGAKTRTGNGSLSYLRLKTAPVATLRTENAGTTTNTFADFEKVNYLPKALTAKIYLTDELQKESIVDLITILRADMVEQFGLAIDNYAINGNTSPAITGLMSAGSGINTANLGTPALPTWATINKLKALVSKKATNLANCSFVMTPDLLAVLEATAKLTNGLAIAEGNKINGYNALTGGNMPIATLNHSALFGDFSKLEICLQGPTEFMVDVQSRFDEGICILTARQYFDIGILQPLSFASCNNFLIA